MREVIDRPIFNKPCKKCGYAMCVRMAKITEDGKSWVECYVVPGADGNPSCYLLGNSTVQCARCQQNHRCYHSAYGVEARTWK